MLKCVREVAFPYGFSYHAENSHTNFYYWAWAWNMSDFRIFYKDISCRTNSFSKLLTSLNILDTTQTGPGFCWLLQFLFSLSSFSTPRYSWESGQNLKVDYWLWILIENIEHFLHFLFVVCLHFLHFLSFNLVWALLLLFQETFSSKPFSISYNESLFQEWYFKKGK